MNNIKEQDFIQSASDYCEKQDVKMSVIANIVPEKMMLFWYGGNVISLKHKNKELVISVVGDVAFAIIDGESGKDRYIYSNKCNCKLDDMYVESLIPDDATMEKMMKNLEIYWRYNNWVEFTIWEGNKKILHQTDAEVTSLKEVFEDIGYYVDLLKREDK